MYIFLIQAKSNIYIRVTTIIYYLLSNSGIECITRLGVSDFNVLTRLLSIIRKVKLCDSLLKCSAGILDMIPLSLSYIKSFAFCSLFFSKQSTKNSLSDLISFTGYPLSLPNFSANACNL